jgi:hypothetical protein
VPRFGVICAFLVFPLAELSAVFEAFGQQFSLSPLCDNSDLRDDPSLGRFEVF